MSIQPARPALWRLLVTLSIGVAALAILAAPARGEALGLPPLIDRELFFGDPEISGAQISPDGRWVSFRRPYRDVMNIWVKRPGEPFDAAKPITADTERPVRGYFWTEDSRYVLYVQDKGGDENYHIYAVDPAGEPVAATGVPEARDLTPLDAIRAYIYAVPEATPNQIIIGLNDRDPALHDVYRLDIDTGKRDLLIQNDTNVARWITDLEGNVRLASRQTPDGGSEILPVRNGQLGKAIYSCSYEETCYPIRFHMNGRQAYIVSNKGENVDLTRLMLMDPETGATQLVESDPEHEVDFGDAIFSDRTEELIATVYVGDRQRIYPRTPEIEQDLAVLRKRLPDGELGLGSRTEDERFWIVSISRDVNPGQVYLYNREQMSVEKLYDSRPELPTEHLAQMRPVRYEARDGKKIPAYLTIPKGVEPRNLPTVLLPHGGPWGRDTWGYDSFAQFLANRGYAVLMPNFRGSAGYGKSFLNAGNEEWGTGVMQHDLSDGVQYLIEEGIADPDRVAIMGGSYGGYATLAGVTFTPDLYAAGISIVGPSNIITLLNSIPPYWGPIKKMFHRRVGDPDDPEDRARLEAQSPFYHAEQIKSPLLVIQGANDPRVKKAESDQIVVAMRDLGRDVEYFVAPDEGHGFAGEENRLAMFAVIERFLAEQLGGRYQTGASPEVSQRMAELQVDVSALEMPTVPEEGEWAKTAPLPVPDPTQVTPMTLAYETRIVPVRATATTIRGTQTIAKDELEGKPVWRITTIQESRMAPMTDVFHLNTTSLTPLRRSVTQGPVAVTLEFTDAAITGMMSFPGQEMPVDVPLEAPVFGNDAALDLALGALPLEPGYRATYRTFDSRTQRVRIWSFEVTGTETVKVPAGEFDALLAEVKAIDDGGEQGVMWFSRTAPHVLVRSVFQRRVATMTRELTGKID